VVRRSAAGESITWYSYLPSPVEKASLIQVSITPTFERHSEGKRGREIKTPQ
jgi:hypothetical protein